MKQSQVGRGLVCAAFWLTLQGCAGVSRVATLPPEAGVLARYDASIDEVAEVVPEALAAAGQEEVERSRPDPSSIAVLGQRGINFSTWGEVSRTLVVSREGGGSDVRVVTRSRDVFDVWSSTGHTLRVVSDLDRLLGPGQIALTAGDRVRGLLPSGQVDEGTLGAEGSRSIVFVGESPNSEPLPLEALTQLEIFRGSYGHGRTGAAIGGTIGAALWIAALGICYDNTSSSSLCGSTSGPSNLVGWTPIIAAVVGGLIGSTVRTSVWSSVGN